MAGRADAQSPGDGPHHGGITVEHRQIADPQVDTNSQLTTHLDITRPVALSMNEIQSIVRGIDVGVRPPWWIRIPVMTGYPITNRFHRS